MAAGTRNSTTQVLRKAVRLLSCFTASEGAGLGLAELSTLTGWTKSSISRLLAALEEGDLVRQDPLTGRYTLGLQLVALAGAALAGDALYVVSHPHLVMLAEASGETANLSVLDAGQLLTIGEVPSRCPIKLSGWVGVRDPLHGSSSGKVLLAGLPAEQREALLAASLPALTPATVTDRDRLLSELACVHAQGYALNVEELAVGLTSAAAPIRDHMGTVIAAISVAGPSFRLAERHLDECIHLVRKAAEGASCGLGWRASAA